MELTLPQSAFGANGLTRHLAVRSPAPAQAGSLEIEQSSTV
jgi:hypothetical protein